MLRQSLVVIGVICCIFLACDTLVAQTSDAVQQVQKREHTVQQGEIAGVIARRYGISLDELTKLNPGRDLARLQIGDKLVIGETPLDTPKARSEEIVPPKPKSRPDKIALMAGIEKEDRGSKKESPGVVKTTLSMVFKLAVVLALAYLTILALKVLSDRRDASPRLRRDLKVVDTIKLSNTSSLHLVDIGGKMLLVGCSTGQVSLLREFDKDEAAKPGQVSNDTFAKHLEKYANASFQNNPVGRVAALLRDCASHLQQRKRKLVGAGKESTGDVDEA